MSATFKVGDRVRTRPGMAFRREGVVVDVKGAGVEWPVVVACPDEQHPGGSVHLGYRPGELEHLDPQPANAPSAIPIGRPVVRLERGVYGTPHRVVCAHCPWTHTSDALVVVREHANCHREDHRLGRIEGTR